jgi:hypothetical protein
MPPFQLTQRLSNLMHRPGLNFSVLIFEFARRKRDDHRLRRSAALADVTNP